MSKRRGGYNKTHGLSGSPEYKVFMGMMGRCYNPNHVDYRNYGARGIRVCDRWRNGGFVAFFEDMGPRPSPRHTIERRDNDGDYTPENCCWATRQEQQSNTRRNIFVTVNGERVTLTEGARRLGLNPGTVFNRYHAGKTPEEALGLE